MILRYAIIFILALLFIPQRAVAEDRTAMPSATVESINIETENVPLTEDLDDYTPPPMFNSDPLKPKAEIQVFDVEVKEEKKKTNNQIRPKKQRLKNITKTTSKPKKLKVIHRSPPPIPPRRPSVIQVSPDYINRLRSIETQSIVKNVETYPTSQQHQNAYSSENLASKFTGPNLAGGRLKNTDIYEILKQIDPDAAKELERNSVENQNSSPRIKKALENPSFRRIAAMPLSDINTPIIVGFTHRSIEFRSPLSQNDIERILVKHKLNPNARVEIRSFPSENMFSTKDARALSYKRAQAIKAILKQYKLPSKIIDLRATARTQDKPDQAIITFTNTM